MVTNIHVTQDKPTTSVSMAVKDKVKTYNLFMEILNKGRPVDRHAKFYPAVLSHAGEFSAGMSELMELIYVQFKRELSKAPERRDSRTTRVQAREFKTQAKDRVIHALVMGINDMILGAGRPYHGGRMRRIRR